MHEARKSPTDVIGRRVGAFVIDFLITGVLYWGLFFLFADRRATASDASVVANLTLGDDTWAVSGGRAALFFLVFLVLGFLYWSVLPGITGWTVGKLATGIRVVAEDGSMPAGVGRNLVRQLMGVADYFPYFLPGLTGFIVALASSEDRRVGDMVAKTYVVRRDAAGQPVSVRARPGLAATAAQGAGPGTQRTPAGWYPDPQGVARLRYWDGTTWTGHTSA
jgi:uncharacterized RDD family membrane protein YckC